MNNVNQQVAILKAKATAILNENNKRQAKENSLLEQILLFADDIFKCHNELEYWVAYPENTDYEISNKGKVKSVKFDKELILKQSPNERGYLMVTLCSQGKNITKKVHNLVAETFLQKQNENDQVNHLNGKKTDNSLSNLEYCSPRENKSHARKNNSSSKYHGVTYLAKKDKYKAQIFWNKKTINLGIFSTEEEASAAYQAFLFNNNIKNKYASKR